MKLESRLQNCITFNRRIKKMKHVKINCRGFFLICILTLSLFWATGSYALTEAEKAAFKGADYAEINNLMSLHSWYHAGLRNDIECEEIWVSPDGEFGATATWAQTSGYWKGMKKIKEKYGAKDSKGNMPDPKGGFVWHTITTPVVEIAEDRKTAKGIWYTPGIVGAYSADGKNNSQWMWEKYGVDFVMEKGKWKVWHMKVYTDFSTPVGEAIGTMGAPPGGGSAPAAKAPGTTPEKQNAGETIGSELGPQGAGAPGPGWDYTYKNQYKGWSKDSIVEIRPRPPKPYKTWSETWSYTDEGE
jgi:hypothetical protein